MSTGYPTQAQYPAGQKIRLDLIGEAWRLFQAQAANWVVSALLVFIVLILVRAIAAVLFGVPLVLNEPGAMWRTNSNVFGVHYGSYASFGQDAVDLVGLVASSYLYCGLFNMANEQVRGRPFSPGMIFLGHRLFVNMLGYNVLASLVTGIAFALCLVPGFFVGPLFWPGYALIADGVPIGEALNRSTRGVQNDIGGGALLLLVFGLLVLVSAIPCFLGFLITFPMSWLLSALMYRDLIGMPSIGAADTAGLYGGSAQPGIWPPPPSVNPAPTNPGVYPPAQNPAVDLPPAPPADAYPPPADPYRPPTEPEEGTSEPPGSV